MIPLDMAIKTAINAARKPAQTAPAPSPASAFTPKPFDSTVQQIANFYASKPVTVTFDATDPNGMLGTTGQAGSGQIILGPTARKSLDALVQNYGSDAGAYDGVEGLATLIHEALHNRGPAGPPNQIDPTTGFYPWDDEWQARQLSYGLVADAMQRFFGVKNQSPLGQRYYQRAEGYSYTDPVKNPFGGPETPNEIATFGQRTRPTTNPWGWLFPWAQSS